MKLMPWCFYRQSGVIPYQVEQDKVEVLLITSRRRGRWIIPKGVIEPGTSAAESACQEAYEEAGVRGKVSPTQIGEYQYDKWGGVCTVKVFTMEVQQVLETWPESGSRRRRWMMVVLAAQSVEELQLQQLMREDIDEGSKYNDQ